MALEEVIKVNLYIIHEDSHRVIPDLYDYSTTDWRDDEPIYFSTKEIADAYMNKRTNQLIIDGYHRYGEDNIHMKNDYTTYMTREFSAGWNNCIMRSIYLECKQTKKESIIHTDNKTYYFDKSDNRMYEIYDTLVEKKKR